MKKINYHNLKVRSTANRYKNNGWKVHADAPGFKRPNPIGKYNRIPDVVAKKGKQVRIFEVETPKSMKTDIQQRRAFSKHASAKLNTTFKVLIAKKPGKRNR